MITMKNTIVYIDGGYVMRMVQEARTCGLGFDVIKMAHKLPKEESLWCAKAYYYTAPPFQSSVPTVEQKERLAKYKHFTESLTKKAPEFTVREGRMQRTREGQFIQKGVDTLITMDLVEEPFDIEGIDTVIIVTSDTDFVPVMERLRKKGIRVIVACYEGRKERFSVSHYLRDACDKLITLQSKNEAMYPLVPVIPTV